MGKNMGKQLALLRLIPLLVLIAVAFGLEYLFNVPRLMAVGIGLVAALALRLALVRVVR